MKVNYYQMMRMRWANKLIPLSGPTSFWLFFAALGLMFSPILAATCGDGQYSSPSEQCDDGNVANGDGCTSACQVEPSYRCANTLGSLSECRIDTVVSLSLMGA
jgi:cysteine-rich repeat protein